MKKVNLLSRAEMKNVMGGSTCVADCPAGQSASVSNCNGTCTASNGSATCIASGGYTLTKPCKTDPPL